MWICAAGALWLLLSPAAFERRAMTRRADGLEAQVREQAGRNAGLERYRNALENDPATIEHEARRIGYGRPNEKAYYLTPDDIASEAARVSPGAKAEGPSVRAVVAKSIAPVLMTIVALVVVMLFFTNLRVEDPAESIPAKNDE